MTNTINCFDQTSKEKKRRVEQLQTRPNSNPFGIAEIIIDDLNVDWPDRQATVFL